MSRAEDFLYIIKESYELPSRTQTIRDDEEMRLYYLHHGEPCPVASLYPAHYYGKGDPYDDLIIINFYHPDDQVRECRVVVLVEHASTHLHITREKRRDHPRSVSFQPSDLDHPI